jgi:imidazolonepropionase-like amidohydrolase
MRMSTIKPSTPRVLRTLGPAMKPQEILVVLFLATAPAGLMAEVPDSDLAKPPADARHYVIQSIAGKHGDSWSWVTTDGTRMGRESLNLRGQVWEVDYTGRPGPDSMSFAVDIRGRTPSGDAGETYRIVNGTAQWKSPVDGGSADYRAPAFYLPYGGPIDATAWFVERLIASPDHTLALLPGGQARATKLTSLDLQGRAPADKRTVDLWAVTGINNSPTPFWVEPNGRFFAATSVVGWIPEAYAAEQARMEKEQSAAMAAQTAQIARLLGKTPKTPVVFAHVRIFDAEHARFLEDQSAVIDHGKIVAVGAAGAVQTPANSQTIDGHGKTLVPGLWDCHMHVGDDYTGVQELSLGVTSVRDPGNDDLKTIDRRTRAAAGNLLSPHVYPSSMIDGKGPYTAQSASVATSQAEAIALVDRAKRNGFTGVKFYGTFNPAWLPASIAEAHKLGLHVHGHIPAGIRPMDAINDGYDEITHINWIIMQAMPDGIIPISNGIARFEAPGRYAKDVDLNGPAMELIVQTMAKKHIYSDPTMVAFEALYVPDNGDLSPAYSPFVGTLPVVVERNFRTGGFAVPRGLTRADYRASWAKLVALLKKMHEAGIPIVAGTDGAGIEIIRELEIYQQAGFSAGEALAAATIVPARLVGKDRQTGSITVGKNADLVLVEGDPSRQLGALRQTRVVMLDGELLDADALRQAAGYSARPNW